MIERDEYRKRLDELCDKHPNIYDLSRNDPLIWHWSQLWIASDESMEEGLSRLCQLLAESRKEIQDQLLTQWQHLSDPRIVYPCSE